MISPVSAMADSADILVELCRINDVNLSGLFDMVFSAASTFGVIAASPVSTINTPSSPECTVILPPAPMITCTLPARQIPRLRLAPGRPGAAARPPGGRRPDWPASKRTRQSRSGRNRRRQASTVYSWSIRSPRGVTAGFGIAFIFAMLRDTSFQVRRALPRRVCRIDRRALD